MSEGAICGDEEERRLYARRDHPAHFHVAQDHCSVDRRNDIGRAEVDLGGMKRRLELGDPRLVELRLRLRLCISLARLVERFPANA